MDELVKRLRSEAECPDNYPEDSCLMREAADAIEELSKPQVIAKRHPLVPVPPHGRLGDLDILKERVTKRLYASNHGSMAEAYYAALIDLIDGTPTVIPAEEEKS